MSLSVIRLICPLRTYKSTDKIFIEIRSLNELNLNHLLSSQKAEEVLSQSSTKSTRSQIEKCS